MTTSTEFHERMSRLFKEDPEAFKKKRDRLITELVESAPPYTQLKLWALQAKFDSTMRKAGSEENRLVLAKSMMMDTFLNEFNPMMQELSKELGELNDKA